METPVKKHTNGHKRYGRTQYFDAVGTELPEMYDTERPLFYDMHNDTRITNMLLVKLIDEVRALRMVLHQATKGEPG